METLYKYVLISMVCVSMVTAQTDIKNKTLRGERLFEVVHPDSGDVYIALYDVELSVSVVNRLSADNLDVLTSVTMDTIIDQVKFMIIDTKQNAMVICTQVTGSCYPHDLLTLKRLPSWRESARCVTSPVSWYSSACTPTGTDVIGFFGGDRLYIATSPHLDFPQEGERDPPCEYPRLASRKTILSTSQPYLQLSAIYSALYVSTFTESRPSDVVDNSVYGFSHNGYSYVVGTYLLQNEYILSGRISRVCQSDDSFLSYMEVPLQCEQRDNIVTRTVTWAEVLPATKSVAESLGYTEGEDILYFIADSVFLCTVSMATVENVFKENIQRCLDGGNLTVAAPESTGVQCRGTTTGVGLTVDDVICSGIPLVISNTTKPLAGTIPIYGRIVMTLNSTRTADIINIGKLTVLFSSDGRGQAFQNVISPREVIRTYGESGFFECPPLSQRIMAHSDNIYLYKVESQEYEQTVTVTKSLLSDCSRHTDCSTCVSDPFCGWCMEEKRCTLEPHCTVGDWLQQKSSYFYPGSYPQPPNDVCLPYELTDNYWLTFTPQSEVLMVGREGVELSVSLTTVVPVLNIEDYSFEIVIEDVLRCGGVSYVWPDYYSYYDGETSLSTTESLPLNYSYVFSCFVHSPEVEYEGLVGLSFSKTGNEPIWFYSKHNFIFATPVVTDFAPRLGPESGGTLIEISGSHLLAGDFSYIYVSIGGVQCEIRRTHSTNERLFCITGKVPAPIQALVTISFRNTFTTESIRRYSYTEDPYIEEIFPLRTFVGGGELQHVIGTNLNSIARPVFVVVMYINNSYVDEFHNECNVFNSTAMTCLTPEIAISSLYNETRSKRSVDDDECEVITRTANGEVVEFHIGFIMDGVEAWLPSQIDQYLDERYTTIKVARNPVFYPFPGFDNVTSFNPNHDEYLVLEGERLDCGARKQDIRVEIGLDYCQPIISLHRTQLTCKPPDNKPPISNVYQDNSDHPHVSVIVGSSSNLYHIGYLSYEIGREEGGVLGWVIAITVCVVIITVVVLVAVAVYLCRRYLKSRNEPKGTRSRDNTYQTPEAFIQGEYQSPDRYTPDKSSADYIELDDSGKRRPILEQLDEGLRLQVQDSMIPSNNLRLMSNDILGKGQFGRVIMGEITNKEGEKKQVAVKILKKNTDIEDVRKFLEEGIMMKDFHHRNVLSLIGVCIDEDQTPLIVLPYMKHGDLKSYIEKPERELTIGTLVTFALHIARGMEYLASLKFVHRDLAARNCMVDESETVRVSDFGLSRDIYEREYYASQDKKAKLPIRWMSLESIKGSIYNVKTDVWSYGVVVWELMTRGELPYSSVDSWDVSNYLEKGKRLPQPSFAPDSLYEMLIRCWHQDPTQRPQFTDLCDNLEDMLREADNDQTHYYLQPVKSSYIEIIE